MYKRLSVTSSVFKLQKNILVFITSSALHSTCLPGIGSIRHLKIYCIIHSSIYQCKDIASHRRSGDYLLSKAPTAFSIPTSLSSYFIICIAHILFAHSWLCSSLNGDQPSPSTMIAQESGNVCNFHTSKWS